MEFAILIDRTSPFHIKGLLGSNLQFLSDLGLRCLPVSHKKDASLKWTNRPWMAGTTHG